MTIDLRPMFAPFTSQVRASLATFVKENAKVPICTIVLCGDGFHGTALLYLDTPEHSAASVEQWKSNGPAWYGQDSAGSFCDNGADFRYCIGEYSFVGFPDLYESEGPDDFITLDGAPVRVEDHEGDEGYNAVVFPFLKAVLNEVVPFSGILRSTPFRVGVSMVDSQIQESWLA